MENEFTQHIEKNFWSTVPNDNPEDALEYLNNPDNFRSFSEGLTILIRKYGYNGNKNAVEEKTKFILEKFSSISASIEEKTVQDWFSEKRRPGLNLVSRDRMFQLCFALSASLEDIAWFFGHVYFDREFNCHTVKEAIYYYCLSRQLPYAHAVKLLSVAENLHHQEKDDYASADMFTQMIQNHIDQCTSDKELLDFLTNNRHIFDQWNKKALQIIDRLLSLIRGKSSDKAVIEAVCKLKKRPLKKEVECCGLVVQEYLLSFDGERFDYISGKSITSIDFMLERILMINSGLVKEAPVPDIVRRNFPSKKTFSDILGKASESSSSDIRIKGQTSTSYDSIRKCLILLVFYKFWVSITLKKLNQEKISVSSKELFDAYRDETDDILAECGYHELFIGNPYDWLFLWASKTDNPLDTLRNVIYTLEDI